MSMLSTQKEQEEILALILFRLDNGHEKDQLDINQLVAKLHAAMSKNRSTWVPTESGTFSFTATILNPLEDGSEQTFCRELLDSGCEDNWVSSEIITRAGLLSQINASDQLEDAFFTGFGGDSFSPTGVITLTSRYASNSATSKKTAFFVHTSVPFDMILGRKWIREESIFVFDKPALALRQGKISKGMTK